jgi:hypothetical protein
MATEAAAKGNVSLAAAAGDPLVLETLYPSSRAFNAVVKDSLTAGYKVVQITEGGVKLVEVEANTIADLEAKLNLTDYVRVRSKGANLPSNTAGAAFANGNDGAVATATEYAAFLDVMEADRRAGAFSLDGVTDEGIQTTTIAWVKRVRDEGFYVTYVRGGASSWDTSIGDANTASKAVNHRGIVNVGNGCDGYTAAEMAIFIAARIASIALNRTLTDEVVDYVVVNKKLKPGERVTAKESGTLVFVQEGDAVVIDEGVNTLTTPGADERKEFGKIRVNNTLDQIAKDTEAFGDEYKKNLSNTQEARETYAATVENSYFRPLETMEVLQPGSTYRPDPEYHGKTAVYVAKIDEAFFVYGIKVVDSMERIYQKGHVNF